MWRAGLRVQWCKARARARRPMEELRLVEEEMRRSVQYCSWQAQWWSEQAVRRSDVSPHLAEGLLAYARERVQEERARGIRWSVAWAPIRERAKFVREYLTNPDRDAITPLPVSSLVVEMDMEADFDDDEGTAVERLSDDEL